jgi:hypothetical protein
LGVRYWDLLELDTPHLPAAGRKSNLILILGKAKMRCFRPLCLKRKFRISLQRAAGKEISAFRPGATSSRHIKCHIKSFHDFIANNGLEKSTFNNH